MASFKWPDTSIKARKLWRRLPPRSDKPMNSNSDKRVADRPGLVDFMMKNFHCNEPVTNFARRSGRSLSTFKREFAQTFGTTPAKWLKNKRLSEAFFLIKHKNKKPQDIYIELGFENLSHFYVSFKRKYGHTPAMINKLDLDDHR